MDVLNKLKGLLEFVPEQFRIIIFVFILILAFFIFLFIRVNFWLIIIAVMVIAVLGVISFMIYKKLIKGKLFDTQQFIIFFIFIMLLLPMVSAQIQAPNVLDRVTPADLDDLELAMKTQSEKENLDLISRLDAIDKKVDVNTEQDRGEIYIGIIIPIGVIIVVNTLIIVLALRSYGRR